MTSKKNKLRIAEIMDDLNKPRGDGIKYGLKTSLHEKQVECLRSIFSEDKGMVFVPCGRKFGKTQLAVYAGYRKALTEPGSTIYYVAPEGSHGRKIVWDTRRIQRFLGPDSDKYITRIQDRDMKVTFFNGSFIQIIGSENWAAANGLTPDFVIYDEFKAFHPQFHIEMDPNRAAKAAPLLIIGTQPKVGDRNKEQYEALLDYAKDHQKECAVFTYTTFDNPINLIPKIKKSIDQQISILRSRGDEDVVQREYFSKIVPGGSKAIFPMLREESVVKPVKDMMHDISHNLAARDAQTFVIGADPATTTCFGALVVSVDEKTKKIRVLREIYEKDQGESSVSKIWPRMRDLYKLSDPGGNVYDDPLKVCDEAAAWFMRECLDQFGVSFQPTMKHVNKKEDGLSLIKDILIHDLLEISDECPMLFKEMQEYAKDMKGNIPKKNDHLIDTLRYILAYLNYNIMEAIERKKMEPDPIFAGIMRKVDEDPEIFPVNDEFDFDF